MWFLTKPSQPQQRFEPPEGVPPCQWCGGYHRFACPYVESIEYDGPVMKRVVLRREHYEDMVNLIAYEGDLVPTESSGEAE